jgi:hypothetical protein
MCAWGRLPSNQPLNLQQNQELICCQTMGSPRFSKMQKVPVPMATRFPSPSRTLASTVAMRRVRWTTPAEQVILPSLTAPRKWTSRPMVAVLRPTSAATESPIALSMSEA